MRHLGRIANSPSECNENSTCAIRQGATITVFDVPVVSDLRQVHDAAQKLMHRYRGTGNGVGPVVGS